MSDANTAAVPTSAYVKMSRYGDGPLDVRVFPSRELVGSLMYLAVCSRRDISQAVGAPMGICLLHRSSIGMQLGFAAVCSEQHRGWCLLW
jgi:hypothetical protein